MQIRGPSPNGKKAAMLSALNRSGSNFSGSGYIDGSRCNPRIGIVIKVPFGIWIFVVGRSRFLVQTRFKIGTGGYFLIVSVIKKYKKLLLWKDNYYEN